jgi:hypothetical protein
MVSDICTHLDRPGDVAPSNAGCEDYFHIRGRRVQLRMGITHGHVACCDNSPRRHAAAHFDGSGHPIIQSYEPEEDWWYGYLDEAAFVVDGAPSFAHP